MPRAFACLAAGLSMLVVTNLPARGEPEATPPPPKPTVVKAGRLFDGTGDRFLADRLIVIEGDRIKSVGAASEISDPRRRRRSSTWRTSGCCPA